MFKKLGFFLITTLVFLFLFFRKNIFLSPKIENKFNQVVAPQPTRILDTGLPNKHLIKTAFVPQSPEQNWDQPWQDACEEAALLTVNYFYKNQNPDISEIRDDILKMIEFENSQNFTHDMNIDQMVLVAQEYLGFKTKIIDKPTIKDIKEYIAQDVPIIVPANGKTLYQENKHFANGGPYYHNLVILGYDDDKNQFTVHDVGTRSGAYFKYSYSLLIQSIHDFPDSKNKSDINTGSKRVLILLK